MQLLAYLLIAAVVAAVLFYCVVALLPDGPPFQATRDDRPFELPADRRMAGEDLRSLRIPVALRGYRFAETDALIDRLGAEIVVRDQELARLRATRDPSESNVLDESKLLAGPHEPAEPHELAGPHELAEPHDLAGPNGKAGPNPLAAEVEPSDRLRDV
ncbi:MAG: cell division protein DivIVA [Frankiales bacterium]|nr:cell division protein DivIVA [Frankiales bacterium]